jgi:hypothetical protein
MLSAGDLKYELLVKGPDGREVCAPIELHCDDGQLKNTLRAMCDKPTQKEKILAEACDQHLQPLKEQHASAREALKKQQAEELRRAKRCVCMSRCIVTGSTIVMIPATYLLMLFMPQIKGCP